MEGEKIGEQGQAEGLPAVNKKTILNKFSKGTRKESLLLIFFAIIVIIAGVATGWFLSGKIAGKTSSLSTSSKTGAIKEVGKIADESKFDMAEGVLKEGGINGEGTHHLEKEGGPSQYVYLTSTSIDLESFVGRKVQVWGETIAGKKAGWLMDVVKIKATD